MSAQSIISAAQTVESECKAFLDKPQDALPRVIERNLVTLLEQSVPLFRAFGNASKELVIYSFPFDRAGLRSTDLAAMVGVRHVVWNPEKHMLGMYASRLVGRGPHDSVMLAPLLPPNADGLLARDVSLSEVVELGVSPQEIVEFMKRMAEEASFTAYASLSGGQVGKA
jgi:hypothetical protein